MPVSIFSYNLTRRYPYSWFTWLVLFGGIAATAIFSVINLAANGYQTSVSYLPNPNATECPPHPQWFQKEPWSWASKVGSSCQDENIVVGSEFYTSNLGFSYKIISVSKSGEYESKPAGSFSYHNDAFRDCNMSTIEISPLGQGSNGAQAQVIASMDCLLYEDLQPITVGLTTSFVFDARGVYSVQENGPIGQFDAPTFLGYDQCCLVSLTEASMRWGQRLINAYSLVLCSDWPTLSSPYLGAQYTFIPDQNLAVTFVYFSQNSTASTYFGPPDDLATVNLPLWTSSFGYGSQAQLGVVYCDDNGICVWADTTQTWTTLLMDGLVKSIYSTILTDLGQAAPSTFLASAKEVMTAANQTVKLFRKIIQGSEFSLPIVQSVTQKLQYNDTTIPGFYEQAGTGIPAAAPATISTQYLCQVPKLKSIGSIVVSVIVADLVFLQAIWIIVTFFMDLFLARHHPEAYHCIGCAKILTSEHGEPVMIMPGPETQGNYTQVSNPNSGIVSPVPRSTSASIRSGAVSLRTGSASSLRRSNGANAQP